VAAAVYMAIVLSNQENIDLLLFLVKLVIAIGSLMILLVLLFWVRLRKIENRLYQRKTKLSPRFVHRVPQKTQRFIASNQGLSNRSPNNFNSSRSQIYRQPSHTQVFKKSSQRSSNSRWRWLFAIAIASVTGIAIALIQLGNSFISTDFTLLIWLLIGITLVASATFVKIA